MRFLDRHQIVKYILFTTQFRDFAYAVAYPVATSLPEIVCRVEIDRGTRWSPVLELNLFLPYLSRCFLFRSSLSSCDMAFAFFNLRSRSLLRSFSLYSGSERNILLRIAPFVRFLHFSFRPSFTWYVLVFRLRISGLGLIIRTASFGWSKRSV